MFVRVIFLLTSKLGNMVKKMVLKLLLKSRTLLASHHTEKAVPDPKNTH